MRKVLRSFTVCLLLAITTNNVLAQIENLKPGPGNLKIDSVINIDKIYAGVLSCSMFTLNSVSANTFTSARLAGRVTWKMDKNFSMTTLGMYQQETGGACWTNHFFLTYVGLKNRLIISAGNLPLFLAEQRPNPASANGQFETVTQASIPGIAPGAKANYVLSQNFIIGGGVDVRNKKTEYQVDIKLYKKLQVSALYGEADKKYGTAATLNLNRIYNTLLFMQDQKVYNLLCLYIGAQKQFTIYNDMGYQLDIHKWVRGELGLLRNFQVRYVKGLLGIGYAKDSQTDNFNNGIIKGYCFIHI